MAFTMEPVQAPNPGPTVTTEASQFNLPVKEFVGYDPKGTTTVTGSPIQRTEEPQEATSAPGKKEASAEDAIKMPAKVTALMRKEQATRQKEQDLVRREKELAQKIEAGEKYLKLQEKIAANDYTAADELGIKYEGFVRHELNKEAGLDPAEQRARKLEEEIANIKRGQEERDVEEYKANQALWKEEITKTTSGSEKFPEIAYRKSKGEDVDQIILQHVNDSFDEDGVQLTAEKAAEEIENFLKERAEFYAESPTVMKKSQGAAKVMGPPKSGPRTITQTMTTTPKTASTSKPFHLMSESEQIAEAIRRVQAAKLNR